MNDRIRELARQAEGTKKHVPAVWQFYDHELEKFVELIVQECIRLADQGFGSDHFGQGITGNTLKDHFGIKN